MTSRRLVGRSASERSVDFSVLANGTLPTVAVTYGVLLALASGAGLLGIPLAILVTLSLWRYAYQVLKRIAQGMRELPAPDIASMNPIGNFGLVLHFGLFASLAVLVGISPRLLAGDGYAPVLIGFIALAFVFPASASLMALTDDIAAALSPTRIVELGRILGKAHAAFAAFALGAGLLVAFVRGASLPGPVERVLIATLALWSLLGIFALIGSALRQRRDELDIPGDVELEEERRDRELSREWTRELDLAYSSIRSGLAAQGYRTIRELVARENGSLDVHHWIFRRTLEWEDQSHAARFAAVYIARLLQDDETQRALEIAIRCRSIGAFRLDPQTATRLAACARSMGKDVLAAELWSLAQRRGDPQAPHSG